jgi:tol-pal system protein YbgF
VLGPQSPGPFRRPRPVNRVGAGVRVLVLLALAGCATRADLVQQDRQLRGMVQEQRKQLQAVQKELERLRALVEEGHGGRGGAAGDDRIAALEQRIAELEEGSHPGAAPSSPATETVSGPPPTTPPATMPPASPPPTTPPPAAAPTEDDAWRREIAREQAAAGAVNVPDRAEYLTLLDALAKQDCARSIPQLNSFAANHKESPLADNALYWAARCYVVRNDQNQAISKFYDVVTRYPKGDKAAPALWSQGNLFVQLGDSPDARLAFSKLIRDYPSSEEATKARQKLSELEN